MSPGERRALLRAGASILLGLAACGHASGQYFPGYSLERDRPACEAGDTPACLRLADAYDSGWMGRRETGQARAYYQQACDRRAFEGCRSLARLDERDATAAGAARAFSRYQDLCQRGDARSCVDVAAVYDGTRSGPVAVDHPRALAMFEEACDRGEAFGCTLAASRLWQGEGYGGQILEKRAVFLRKGCDLKDGEACYALGAALEQGAGVPKDEKAGRELMEHACRVFHVRACIMY